MGPRMSEGTGGEEGGGGIGPRIREDNGGEGDGSPHSRGQGGVFV